MSSARPFAVAFFVGLFSAIAGLLLVGWLANACVDWYNVSSFDPVQRLAARGSRAA